MGEEAGRLDIGCGMDDGSGVCREPAQTPATAIAPGAMPRVGTVDERFQSYNIEAVEVTGGRFWKPYASAATSHAAAQPAAGTLPGMDPSLYEYRPPIDLSNPRLRKLAAALGPAYVRVERHMDEFDLLSGLGRSGSGETAGGLLQRVDTQAVEGRDRFRARRECPHRDFICDEPGTRDAAGVWTPKVAQGFMAYTKSAGGSIAAAEFMNEPTFPEDRRCAQGI